MATFLALVAMAGPARAEEGMWTFDAFPARSVERDLGVRLDRAWLDHLRAGSVRLTSGCSAALVSPRGLVVTNQHCVLGCVEALSDHAHDHLRDGFGAAAAEPPRSCPGLQAEILAGIVDITAQVQRASEGRYGDDYVAAREAVFARAEREACADDRHYRCQVISFFGGGQFKLYRYRKYDDVRLVFAPEFAVAFFGGDRENFSFPRYDLDVAALRLYEHGAPASMRTWLSWSQRPPIAGEAVFVSGSPAATERDLTVAQLTSLRDVTNPQLLTRLTALRARLETYAAQGADQRRAAAPRLFDLDNELKVLRGQAAALADPGLFAARRREEGALRSAAVGNVKLASTVGDPWADVAAVQRTFANQFPLWRELESGAGGGSRLFGYARTLVRAAAERQRPTAARLPEYADARLPLLRKTLLDDAPIDAGLETASLEAWLGELSDALGPGDPAAQAFLGQADPAATARALVSGSRLADPAVRAALWRGGMAAIRASDDPLIAYVLRTDPTSRSARLVWENEVIGPMEDGLERIARIRLAARGAGVYPDATFSPRVSFGRVSGWRDGAGPVAPFTTFAGLYGHAGAAEPWRLPARWLRAREALNPARVLDFVTTNDIVGGSSGSPVVDAAGQMVGAAFDGNQGAIAGDFVYDGAANRTVVVSTAAIGEALAKVYGRADLVRELEGR